MTFTSTPLSGVYLLQAPRFSDQRGTFRKTFHAEIFREQGLDFSPREEFYSISHRDVLRGMHFQVPPHEHSKLVCCIHGRILDVCLDLREQSETKGCFFSVELSEQNATSIYLPAGCAHGFLSLEDESITTYSVASVHAPAADQGIRWDSFGFEWPCRNPIVSPRDAALTRLTEFQSPF